MEFHTSYMEKHNSPDFIKKAKETLKDVDYDTMVGIGFSGLFAILKLAPALGKTYLALRKLEEQSHSCIMAEGSIGEKWIFVDDFIAEGGTFKRVLKRIEELQFYNKFKTEFVGCYLYKDDEFVPANKVKII